MKTLYIDCGMGAAGDMISAALLELLPENEQSKVLEKLNAMGLDEVSVKREKVIKCGISGSHIDVFINGATETTRDIHDPGEFESEPKHDHGHHGKHISDIDEIIDSLDLSKNTRDNAKAVYRLIAEAESNVHGVNVSEVHFHEVGTMDAIMDVSAVCLLMEIISPDRVIASAVHTGSGKVKCSHGIMPVPAPATAYLLQGLPVYSTGLEGELCTPTGAALLKYFVNDFGPMPAMTPDRIGYGMGKKDYPAANCLRMILGESQMNGMAEDTVTGLSCNVDDMTGEEIGFAVERLYSAGAKDVFTVPVGMKKSRPGIMLEVLCGVKDKEKIIREIFKHTSTIGIREIDYKRHILDRTQEEADTAAGKVRIKKSEGYGVTREKYEYEDLAKLAREKDLSLRDFCSLYIPKKNES